MIRKIVGIILLVIGVILIVTLLTYGGAIFPHISGPIVLMAIGIVLLVLKRKEKNHE